MNAFVTKLNAKGTGLVYSTFLGGYGNTWATGIAVDAAGRAYVAGNQDTVCNASQMSTCFPTTSGAVIGTTSMACCAYFTFISVFDPTGAELLYSTLFGDLNDLVGSAVDSPGSSYAAGAAVDSNGDFYLFGETEAGRLPTTLGVVQPTSGPLDPTGGHVANLRGYIAKFNPVSSTGGPSLAWATYLGGHTATVGDLVSGLAVDSAGNVYVGGATNSSDFPVTTGAYSTTCGYSGSECVGGHLTKLNSSAQIVWSTYVGGTKQDGSDNMSYTGPVQLDGKGNVYFIGTTYTGFPLIDPAEPWAKGAGGIDLVVVELDPTGSQMLFSSVVGSGGLDGAGPGGMAVDSAGNIYVGGWINGPDLITTPGAFQTKDPTPSCCTVHSYLAKIAATPPHISAVVDAAGSQPGISPGAWISIYGTNLAYTSRGWLSSEIVGGKLPTLLDGVSVTIDSKLAAVSYISPAQLNVQVPDDTATGLVPVAVTTPQGTATFTTTMQTFSPGLFMYQAANARYVAAQHGVDYSIVGPPGLYPGASSPAKPGEVIILYTTGFGPTSPPTPSGQVVTNPAPVANLSAISMTIGGQQAQVQWAGITMAGLWQLNVQVPAGAASGDAAIMAQIGGKSTQAGAFVTIQGP
jgi:uncharacterized protein (TIGR03437 family)